MIVTLTNFNIDGTIFTVYTYIDNLVKHGSAQLYGNLFIYDKQLISTKIRPTVQE